MRSRGWAVDVDEFNAEEEYVSGPAFEATRPERIERLEQELVEEESRVELEEEERRIEQEYLGGDE